MNSATNETEWTVFLYEIHQSSVRYMTNRQEIIRAADRDSALEKAKMLERGETHLIGVSLTPTKTHNAMNSQRRFGAT